MAYSLSEGSRLSRSRDESFREVAAWGRGRGKGRDGAGAGLGRLQVGASA